MKQSYCEKIQNKMSKSKSFIISDISNKGQGFLSSREILSGELIIKERAGIILSMSEINEENILKKYRKLTSSDKKTFDNLSVKDMERKQKCDIFLNNAINIFDNHYGIFWTIARVNHCCSPNAAWGTTEDSNVLELRAIKDIPSGEEICVDYIGDRSYLMSRQDRRSLLLDTWGFDIGRGEGEEEGNKERQAVDLLVKIRTRLREKMCAGDQGQVFRLHSQKMMTLTRMSNPNHQELATAHQVQVLLAVISRQPVPIVKRSMEDWARFCDSDGLYETRKSFEDISSSIEDGEPKEMREFFEEDNGVRKEWIKWIYNKL